MGEYIYLEGVQVNQTKENILKLISQEDIFKMVFGYTPQEHRYVTSIFREDKTPDCYFEWYKNTLYFIDWAETTQRRHRDCFNAIQDIHKVNFGGALAFIVKTLTTRSVKAPPIKEENILPKEEKLVKEIPFKARAFNSAKDKEFWSWYGITKAHLFEDEVFPLIWYKVFSKRFKTYVVIRPNTRSYLIGNFGERVKIYTPDLNGKGKWVTNCTQNDVGGLDSLIIAGDLLVITKSYKDYRVLKNQGIAVVWFQNEGMFPSDEILFELVNRFKKVVIFYDNDATGIKASAELAEFINTTYPEKATSIHLPKKLLKEKISDPSDMYRFKGEEKLREFLIKNKLIINI